MQASGRAPPRKYEDGSVALDRELASCSAAALCRFSLSWTLRPFSTDDLAPLKANLRLEKTTFLEFNYVMPTLEQVEEQVRMLTKADREALLDWLVNMVEDELELTEEFKAKIERGEQEGQVYVRDLRDRQFQSN